MLPDGSRLQVEPVLVGRNEQKLAELADRHGVAEWTTDLDGVLADPSVEVYFDAQVTSRRYAALTAAMKAGKHIYTEKPTAETLEEAVDLARLAVSSGVTAGVVHDKLYLPGLVKLRRLVDEGFFGRILSLRGEFGYWVFEGDVQPAQRPSWNYRAEDGGGMTVDMFCHWNYVLEGILGPVRTVTAQTATHIPRRWDEQGSAYAATADDAAYGIFECGDARRRPGRRPDQLLVGGARAPRRAGGVPGGRHARLGRRRAVLLRRAAARPHAQAGVEPRPADHRALPGAVARRTRQRRARQRLQAQWEQFLRDVVAGRPHRYDLLSAARGVQLAELGLRSSPEGRRLDMPELGL